MSEWWVKIDSDPPHGPFDTAEAALDHARPYERDDVTVRIIRTVEGKVPDV